MKKNIKDSKTAPRGTFLQNSVEINYHFTTPFIPSELGIMLFSKARELIKFIRHERTDKN